MMDLSIVFCKRFYQTARPGRHFSWDGNPQNWSPSRFVALKISKNRPAYFNQDDAILRFFGGRLECLMIEHDQNTWAGNVVKITSIEWRLIWTLLLNGVDERQTVELGDIY